MKKEDLKGYDKYPRLVQKVCDFLLEAKNKYPECKVDCDGQITYANRNDGTLFDWNTNNRLCELGWGAKNGSMWAFKCLLYSDGDGVIYCYPNGELKPVETIERNLMSPDEAFELYQMMLDAADRRWIFDATLDKLSWSENSDEK